MRSACSFAGCGQPARALGYCGGHWQQANRGAELTPLRLVRSKGEPGRRDAAGRKECRRCARWVPESGFRPDARMLDGLSSYCRLCFSVIKHGISTERYLEIEARQGGVCAICATPTPSPSRRSWDIDHDHSCCPGQRSCGKCVRGLLCHSCNVLLGCAKDNVVALRAAIAYLEEYSA